MKKYKVKVFSDALFDIQEITDWYNKKVPGLGKRFQNTAIKHINSLKKGPQIYAIRYNEIHCILIKDFPYMAHFYINDEKNRVEVLAVISTDRDPNIWREKTDMDS